jgi:hypothetical protein
LNTAAAVKALVDGDLQNKKIAGYQYGYALEAICQYLGQREGVEALEDVHLSDFFAPFWTWILNQKKRLVPFNDYHDGDFPFIGYLQLADIPKEIKRTKKIDFYKELAGTPSDQSQQKAQMSAELAVWSADYETATVSPAEFPWLDESYYDSVQKELEALGFRKIRDGENLHASNANPEVRHFFRAFINAERNVSASVTQIRVVEPQTDEHRNIGVRVLEFTSEFADGTFLETTNADYAFGTVDGINFMPCPADMADDLYNYHRGLLRRQEQAMGKGEPLTWATDDDIEAVGKRMHLLMRADRQKKLQALETGAATEEPDEELLKWLEEIRTGLLDLYEKALEANKDIVTFYY